MHLTFPIAQSVLDLRFKLTREMWTLLRDSVTESFASSADL